MTEEEVARLAIKGMVAELPEEAQRAVAECVGKIRDVMNEYGEIGPIAIAAIGSELAAKPD